jgi:hypothetical protein
MTEEYKSPQVVAFEGMMQEIWETLPVPIDPETKKPSVYNPLITRIIWLYALDIVDVLGRSPRDENRLTGEIVYWENLEYAIPRNMFRLWLNNSVLDRQHNGKGYVYTINWQRCSFFDTPTRINAWVLGYGKTYEWVPSQRSDDKPDFVGVRQNGYVIEAGWHNSGGFLHRTGDKPAVIEVPERGGKCRMIWATEERAMRKLHPWLIYFSWPGGCPPSMHGYWCTNTKSGHVKVWDRGFKDPNLQSPGEMTFAESVQKFIQPELDKMSSYKPHQSILDLTEENLKTTESPVKVYLDYLDTEDGQGPQSS